MTNEEAKDILQSLKFIVDDYSDDVEEALNMAIDAINQTAWIPVGEKLPEPYRHVLVSLDSRYDGDATYDWITETLDGKLKWCDWDGYVIAWMPLPERYRGGDGK